MPGTGASEVVATHLDTLLLCLIALFASAAAVVSLRILAAALVASFDGLRKFLGYVYLTYTYVWVISVGLLKLGCFLILACVFYYFMVSEETKLAVSLHIAKAAPTANLIAEKARGQIVVFNAFRQAYMRQP